MAVIFDAKSTQFTANPGTSLSDTSLTVDATANALLVLISRSGNEPSVTCTWNGVSLTLVANVNNGFDETTEIWGLLNPASGAKTLAITWTNAQACCASGISFKGVDTSSLANAFTHANNSTGATGPATVTITSAIDDIAVACHGSVFCTLTEDNISIYNFTSASGFGCAANRAAGAASVTLSATQSAAQTWCSSGINVHAAAAPQGPFDYGDGPVRVARSLSDASKPTNLNLFKNTIPFGPYDYSVGPRNVTRFLPPDASKPTNINLFKNSIPFGPYDYSSGPRRVFDFLPDVSQATNLNLFKNVIPFGPFDYNHGPAEPQWRVPVAQPYNVSLYTVTVAVQTRAPVIVKALARFPTAVPFNVPYNLNLYSGVVEQIPFSQTIWGNTFFPETPPLGSPSVNINLFTNPIPFGPYDYADGAFRVPPLRPDATQPLNPNLFTNPIPFAKLDWFPVDPPPNSPPQAFPYNINVFTNPLPFAKFDYPPVEQPPWSPPQAVPYNINIFTNPIPFAQFDWSHPFVPTPYFPPPVQALNLQLFTNPIPFFNFVSQPPAAPPFFASTVPYNVPLYTVTVVGAPFAQYDWPIAKTPRPQVDATRALNPNLFTNPIPFIPIDYSAITPRIPRAPDQAYYNLNVYTIVIVAAPFIPIDYSKPFFPRVTPPDASQSTSINLLPDPSLFMQVDWTGSAGGPFPARAPDQVAYNLALYTVVTPSTPFIPIDWSKPFFPRSLPPAPLPVNLQLFTNPIPFFNLELKGVSKPTGTPDLSVPYNVNLYGVVTVTPFAQYDWSKPFPPRPAPAQAQPFNPNLFTNPIPFAQFYWPTQFNVPQAQLNRSVQTNINIFTNSIPFVQNQYPGQRPVRIGLIPMPPYNPNIYTATPVSGQPPHIVKFIGNMGHFMIR